MNIFSLPSIPIAGEITDTTVRDICMFLSEFEKEHLAVRIDICSGGGCVEAGIAIANRIRNSPLHIVTCNLAQVASSAFTIFAAGHERVAMPESFFLYHEISVTLPESKISELRVAMAELDKDLYRLESIMARLTDTPLSMWQEFSKSPNDTILTPEKALSLNIIHKIC